MPIRREVVAGGSSGGGHLRGSFSDGRNLEGMDVTIAKILEYLQSSSLPRRTVTLHMAVEADPTAESTTLGWFVFNS